ncbi:rhodanese-like domain-containing protein [Estrella lausannensis]|uniref:Conserved putative membrane protein n=1 Tax=Estrella lausannensis TaxID=483423 RepID=A0A0H5DRT8_9BACT|nr:rhodanese-like domain-containing protein [Estrella lausannensis]CRX39332.1 Conserved putative membrane protein [Estrella lausannensis]
MESFSTVGPESLHPVDFKNEIILDVRTRVEHDEKHIGFEHVLVPVDELNPSDFMKRHGLAHDAAVYILCRSGKRASQAAQAFVASGYSNVKVIEGGIIACEEFGHPIKGYGNKISSYKRPISLERQVRIAAGLLTLTGSALGLLINPLFTLIPLFVGGGLVFAGLTDSCGMGLLLAKAPWNRKEKQTEGPSCCSFPVKSTCHAPEGAPLKGDSCQISNRRK